MTPSFPQDAGRDPAAMATTPWAKSHPSGVREIDGANECLEFLLERHFLGGIPCDSDGRRCPKIDDVLRFLTRKFAREENLMERVGFGGLAHHRIEHAGLLVRLGAMRNRLICGAYDPRQVFSVVTVWAVRHLREFDDPFGRYLAARVGTRNDADRSSWRLEI